MPTTPYHPTADGLRRPRYIPPKPRRWHEELSWTLIFNPSVLILGLFAAAARKLPSERARFSAFAGAGFVVGLAIGLGSEIDWKRGLTLGAVVGTIGIFVYAAMHFSSRGNPAHRSGWTGGVIMAVICVVAAVVVSVMLLLVT